MNSGRTAGTGGSSVFTVRRQPPADRCEHCHEVVDRVWLVPGDVLDSCRQCYREATGQEPVHAHGHTSARDPQDAGPRRPRAAFYVRLDGRRPA